jgi:hypothetical protein
VGIDNVLQCLLRAVTPENIPSGCVSAAVISVILNTDAGIIQIGPDVLIERYYAGFHEINTQLTVGAYLGKQQILIQPFSDGDYIIQAVHGLGVQSALKDIALVTV